jgi:hypothetical protein
MSPRMEGIQRDDSENSDNRFQSSIFPITLYFYSHFYCCSRGTLWHLQKFLQYIKYFILEFTPSIILLYFPHPEFLEQFQQVSFFHLHTCVHSICTMFTLQHLSLHIPPCHWYQPPRQDKFCPVLCFGKEKYHFCLLKITLQGVSL